MRPEGLCALRADVSLWSAATEFEIQRNAL